MKEVDYLTMNKNYEEALLFVVLFDIRERSRWGKIKDFDFSLTTSRLGGTQTFQTLSQLVKLEIVKSDLVVHEKDVEPQYISDVGADFQRLVKITIPSDFNERYKVLLIEKISVGINSKTKFNELSNALLISVKDSFNDSFNYENLPSNVTDNVNWYLALFYLEEQNKVIILNVASGVEKEPISGKWLNKLSFSLKPIDSSLLKTQPKEPIEYQGFEVYYDGVISSHVDEIGIIDIKYKGKLFSVSRVKQKLITLLILKKGGIVSFDDLIDEMGLENLGLKIKKRRLIDAISKINSKFCAVAAIDCNFIHSAEGRGYYIKVAN